MPLLIIGVTLSDLAALVVATSATSSAIGQAREASSKAREFQAIAQTVQAPNNPTLNAVASNLQAIGQRQSTCSKIKAFAIGLLSLAGVGTIHALVSAIACAALKGSAALGTSSSLMSAFAFFSASCCPPVLIAIATIAAVGGIICLALKLYNQQKRDRQNALDGLNKLNDVWITILPAGAPPAGASAAAADAEAPAYGERIDGSPQIVVALDPPPVYTLSQNPVVVVNAAAHSTVFVNMTTDGAPVVVPQHPLSTDSAIPLASAPPLPAPA